MAIRSTHRRSIARNSGRWSRLPTIALLLVLPLTAFLGCKPGDESARAPTLLDPTADARTVLPSSDPDAWLADQVAAHRALAAASDDAVPEAGPSPEDALIARARDAFGQRDFAALGKLAGSEQAAAVPEILALLVRAQSLQKRPTEAVATLARLSALPHSAHEVTALRLHADTVSLRSLPRFRQLTRYVPVELSPTRPSDASRLTPLLAALRAAGLPARAGKPWRGKVPGATIYYTRDLAAAESVAQDLHDILALPPQVLASRYLTRKRPIVLVLPPDAIAALNPSDKKTRVEDFLGRTLYAKRGRYEHQFMLRDTGFFRWETRAPGERVVERTGRYHLYATKIALSYRVLEHEGDRLKPTDVQQGRRSTHRFRLTPDGFRLDDWDFRVR